LISSIFKSTETIGAYYLNEKAPQLTIDHGSTSPSILIIVGEELNFHRAAHWLGVSQPAVTKQIHALEAELGLNLFVVNVRRWPQHKRVV